MEDNKKVYGMGMRGGRGGGGRGVRSFEKPKNLWSTTAKVLKYLAKSKFLVIVIVICLLVSSISALAGSYFLKPLINNYIIPGDFNGLAVALLILGIIYLVGAGAAFLQNRFTVKAAQTATNTIRRDLFDKMQGLELRYFDSHTHGELMSRYTNDVYNVQLMLEQSLTQLISSALTFIGSVTMMIILSPILFIITAIVLATMIFISMKIAGKSSYYFKNQQEILGELNGYIEENINGLKEIKVFNHEEHVKKDFGSLNDKFRKTASNANFLAGIIMPIMGNLNNICYAATAVFGGILILMNRFDIGSLAAFLQYSRHIGQPINQITAQVNNIMAALAGAERVFEVMEQEPEVDNGNVTLVNAQRTSDGNFEECKECTGLWVWKHPQDNGEVAYTELKGDVRFFDVNFEYEPGVPVLRDVSLYAKPGQKIAFVGSTGAGKTTITNLINRFYDVNEGEILYDGINVTEIKKADLRRSLAMVLQDTHLFTDTVIDNIRYGRLDATDEECINAAGIASADSFISRLPHGYHTVIRGDGGNLSQGERQLIAIARAVIASPPVMILDEATSSIDTHTERLIEKGMDALMAGRTVFVIAHRLSTVRNANAIIVIEHGQIIERGDHEELLALKGRYYQLCTGQIELE
jgi:ATP-binding cassette subfamily B protein